MEGDSMVNPAGLPTIPSGVVLTIDPKSKVKNGDIAMFHLVSSNKTLIKKYVEDGPNSYLVSLNSMFPPIVLSSDYKQIGKAVHVGYSL